MRRHLWILTVLALISAGVCAFAQDQWPTVQHPETDPIASISTYPEEYLDWMDAARRKGSNAGQVFIYDGAAKRAKHYREMLDNDGPAAFAQAMVAAYPSDEATMELAAGAIALAARTGYMTYGHGHHVGDVVEEFKLPKEIAKDLPRKQSVVPERLLKSVDPVIDEIVKIESPYAQDVATEMLLQVFSETLMSGHNESHNGRRRIQNMPRELTARAASFLGAKDPFTHAVAEWAVSVNVCNENDNESTPLWPGENTPEWWDTWTGIPESKHLELDYIRQVITLGMHRRGTDLLTLSKDQMRRAEEKAAWIKSQVSEEKAAEVDALVAEMRTTHEEFASAVGNHPDDLTACRKAYLRWRPTVRPVVMAGPDLDFDSVIYAKRPSGGPHGQPGAHLFNKWGVGGDIYVQNGLDPDAPTRAVIGDQLPERMVQDLDLWYDASKVVFAATYRGRIYQLWEVGVDGEDLTRLTETQYNECDPAYLPDGGVVFGSTRIGAGVMCGGGKNSHTNIFRLSPDRKETRRLSYCKDDDAYPYVLNDGRIVWMRWDYQERGVNEIFSLWVCRPDGTGADAYYRVHIPMGVIVQTLRDPEPVPGSDMIIAAGASHRTHNEGTLVLADPGMGINNPLGIRTVTPYSTPTVYGYGELMRPVEEGGVPYVGGVVAKPQALTEKTYLASMCYDMPQSNNFQLYYMDNWGNKELIHRDKLYETVCAMPLAPREAPPVIPDMTDQDKNYATLYVDNVYRDLPGVEKGEVKYIRILDQLFWFPHQRGGAVLFDDSFRRSGGTGQGATRIIGTVPVAPDGSAHFKVPAGIDLYFQALDKDYRAVQRMRTHVEFAPGENRSCVGCHETRGDMAQAPRMGLALNTAPAQPRPPFWGDSTFISYREMVQPVLEKKCVKCHGADNPKAGLDLTATKGEQGYMQSYRSLFGLAQGQPIPKNWRKAEPRDQETWDVMNSKVAFLLNETRGEITQPKQFGSPVAPLGKKLAEDPDHRKLLNDDEMELIMTWLDIRAPYWDSYYQRKHHVTINPYDPWGESREHEIILEKK